MLRALWLAVTVLGIPLGPTLADAPPGEDTNAALKYWQAFATLPKLTDPEQSKLTGECLTMPLDAHARELVTKAAYSLRLMYQGTALALCEWGIDWEKEGIEALLPQMNAARVLSSLACLRARIRFEEGHNAEALDDIVAATTLGRHVSLDGSLIGVLVGYNIEGRLIEAIALHLRRLDAGMIKGLRKRLDSLPPGGRPAVGLRTCEEKTLDWFIRKVKATKTKEELLSLLGMISVTEGNDSTPAAKARAFLAECGGTAEGVLKFAEKTRPCYALTAKIMELPLDQFEKEFALEARKKAGNPVFNVFFPAIVQMRRAQARAEVRHALLDAAFAVQSNGRDSLKDHSDPVIGGSFEYVAFEGGFELRSKFMGRDNKPVTLTVGKHS